MVSYADKLREICERNKGLPGEVPGVLAAKDVALVTESDRKVRRRAAGIPTLHCENLDLPREEAPLAWARDKWVPSGKAYGIMSGEKGVGKSFAAAWVIDREGGRFTNAYDLAKAGMYGDDKWDEIRLASCLAIDELGLEPKDEKGYWEAKLFRLLAGRLEEKRRTLLTTNLSKAALKAAYGSDAMTRLWDRLEANWLGQVFTGPSMRKAAP